jgi:short subunit fatty acids transporter
MMEFSAKTLGLTSAPHKTKRLSLEYLIGIILAFSLWGYHLIKTAVISQDIASKRKKKIKIIKN